MKKKGYIEEMVKVGSRYIQLGREYELRYQRNNYMDGEEIYRRRMCNVLLDYYCLQKKKDYNKIGKLHQSE